MYSSFARFSFVASRSDVNAIRVRATPRFWVSDVTSSEAWCANIRGLSARPV